MFLGGCDDRFTVFYVRAKRLDYVLWSKKYPLSLNVRGPFEVAALGLTFSSLHSLCVNKPLGPGVKRSFK